MGMQLNTGDTGRTVTAAADGSMYANILGDGCYVLSNGSQFSSAIQSNNKIKISDGDLMMQGRHAWIAPSDSQIMTIDNGASGYNRIDLIVARYKKDSAGKEDITLTVIKGSATTGTAAEPSYTSGDILAGATQKDFPLYAVQLTGINITAVTKKFSVLDTMAALQTAITQLNSNLFQKHTGQNGKFDLENGLKIYWGRGTTNKASTAAGSYYCSTTPMKYPDDFTPAICIVSADSGNSGIAVDLRLQGYNNVFYRTSLKDHAVAFYWLAIGY